MRRPFAPSLTSVSNSPTFSAVIRPLSLMTTSPFSTLVSFSTRPLLRILTSVRSMAHSCNGLFRDDEALAVPLKRFVLFRNAESHLSLPPQPVLRPLSHPPTPPHPQSITHPL